VAVYRRSSRSRYTLLLLVLTAVTLLTLDARSGTSKVFDKVKGAATDAFAPVQEATSNALQPVGNFFTGAVHYGDLKHENARLRDQIQEQQASVVQAAEAERESQALKDQQKLDFVGDIPTVAASVVTTSTSNFDLTVEINRGTDAGVAVGMPVVAASGLVGRVIRVSHVRATVLLVTDPSSNVGVRIVSSGEVAVAGGNGPGRPLRLDFVDAKTTVKKSDAVVTSGLQGGRYPPGLPVGKVSSVVTAPGAIQPDVEVDPIVDLHRLEFVKVLQWSP
jgi:rod shape-determining protein MreC